MILFFNQVKKHFVYILSIFIVAFYFLGISIQTKPIAVDNLIALSFTQKSVIELITNGTTSYLPVYRPIPLLTVWFQYQLHNLDYVPYYFLVNLLIWIFCILLFYFLIYSIIKSRLTSLLIACIFLLDIRLASALGWIIERQNTLAALFGLLTFLLIIKDKKVGRNFLKVSLIFILLLFSSLCKEYGLAFYPALIVLAYKLKRENFKTIAAITIMSFLIYFLIRFFLIHKSVSINKYCEDMGIFWISKTICYRKLNLGKRLTQYTYNIMATFIGIFFPSFFNSIGTLTSNMILSLDTLVSVVFFCFSLIALIKKPKFSLAMFSLVLASACLSFMIFRGRNQIVGLVGYYTVVGIGLHYYLKRIKNHQIKLLTIVLLLIISINHGHILQRDIVEYSRDNNPCTALEAYPLDIDKDIATRINRLYKVDKDDCVGKKNLH